MEPECLGLSSGFTSDSSFQLMHIWDAADDGPILESLPPTRETWTEFTAPGFGLVQSRLSQAFEM